MNVEGTKSLGRCGHIESVVVRVEDARIREMGAGCFPLKGLVWAGLAI